MLCKQEKFESFDNRWSRWVQSRIERTTSCIDSIRKEFTVFSVLKYSGKTGTTSPLIPVSGLNPVPDKNGKDLPYSSQNGSHVNVVVQERSELLYVK